MYKHQISIPCLNLGPMLNSLSLENQLLSPSILNNPFSSATLNIESSSYTFGVMYLRVCVFNNSENNCLFLNNFLAFGTDVGSKSALNITSEFIK